MYRTGIIFKWPHYEWIDFGIHAFRGGIFLLYMHTDILYRKDTWQCHGTLLASQRDIHLLVRLKRMNHIH